MRVGIYYNLHKHVWSIKPLHLTRICAYATRVILDNVTFKVSEAGRQRVIREQCKNVHAYACGDLGGFEGTVTEAGQGVLRQDWSEQDEKMAQRAEDEGDLVTYRPYEFSHFIRLIDGAWVKADCSSLVLFPRRKVLAL